MADEDKRTMVVAVCASMLAFAAVGVAIRMATRVWIILGVGLDDWLIVAALVMTALETISMLVATKYGLGRHVEYQAAWMIEPYQKSLLVSSPAYSGAAAFIKLSLLAFYLRLSNDRSFRYFIYAMAFVSSGFGIASIVTVAFQCIPLSMLWDPKQTGSCLDLQAFYYANAALNIATDFIIYALPIPMLWRLRLPLLQRLGLCLVLSMGALAVFASIFRISTLHLLLKSPDYTWNIISPGIWSTIELNIAIVASCVPAFKGCITYFLPHLLGTIGSATRSNQTPYSKRYITGGSSRRKASIPLAYVRHNEGFGVPSNNTTTVVGTGRDLDSWDGSEEDLVDAGGDISMGGIVQTKDVWVEHEDIGAREGEISLDRKSADITLSHC